MCAALTLNCSQDLVDLAEPGESGPQNDKKSRCLGERFESFSTKGGCRFQDAWIGLTEISGSRMAEEEECVSLAGICLDV